MPRPLLRRTEHVRGVKLNLFPSEWEQLRALAFAQHTTLSEQARRAVGLYLLAQQRPTRPAALILSMPDGHTPIRAADLAKLNARKRGRR